MTARTGRSARSTIGIAGIVAVAAVALVSCGNNAAGDGFNQTVVGEGGSKSSVRYGNDAKVPDNFPAGVPLPEAGALRVVVSEANPPNVVYTMTYSLGGQDGIEVGNRYRDRLAKAGFRIDHYSAIGGSDGEMAQFDAIGKKWDVAVVSGKANLRDRASLSVQVHTHGQISGIGRIGDTTPSVTAPPGSGVEIPDPDASTTTTTLGL